MCLDRDGEYNHDAGIFLGRPFKEALIGELEALGVDACGENGKFHMLVLDGPNFLHSVDMDFGETLAIGEYCQRVLKLKGAE